MTYNNSKNIILPVLFAFMALASCIDEDFLLPSSGKDYDIPEGIKEGYSINLIVTLDKMGGTRAASGNDPLEEIENYIDPEKFRVLVFDSLDKFLFESKSRWVKKVDPSNNDSEWLVSIPVFTYGNDTYETEDGSLLEWDWERIREALTKNKFKIAILANRPELDYYPKLSNIEIGAHWYDNRGPYWTPEDTGKKDVFDLHHCQYDPMYHGKSATDLNESEASKYSGLGIGFYDFIMDDWDKTVTDKTPNYYAMRPKMGATSSWAEQVNRKYLPDNVGAPSEMTSSDYSYAILPSYEYPIPMYGIQEFKPITNWTKGTPFHLSDLTDGDDSDYEHKTISLLRSVVRLDLLIPKSSFTKKPNIVGLWYPNIYSRCEPMDVWTPTDLIWETDHENACEWQDIMAYGLTVSKYETKGGTTKKPTTTRNADSKLDFQNTISWFYGAWKDKEWPFLNSNNDDLTPIEIPNISYPRIFNPCVQRNKFVICSIDSQDPDIRGDVTELYNDGYWHFVAYTGERNMIDTNRIPLQGSQTSYTVTWMFKDVDRNQYFCIPIADYSNPQSYARNSFGPYENTDWAGSSNLPKVSKDAARAATTQIINYANTLRDNVRKDQIEEMPWPLLRNHVYRITVTGPAPTELTESYTWDFTKSLNATTVYNMGKDDKWIDSEDKKTVELSWKTAPSLSTFTGEAWEYTGTSNNVATWTKGGDQYSIMIMRSDKAQSSGNDLTIKGDSYKTIKVSNGAQNKLILPENKVTEKMTLYSYVNANPPTVSKVADSYWKEVAGTSYTIDETGMSTYNDRNGADKFTFTYGATREVTFTNAGSQCCYVVFVEVKNKDVEQYWELKNPSGELKANGKIIPELQGLKFSATGIYIYPSKIRLTGATTTITFPTMPEGTTITINGAPVSNNVTNWITPNGSNLESNGTNNSWKVKSKGTAAFTFNGGSEGVDIYEIRVVVPANARSTRTVSNGNEGGLRVQSEDLHSKSIRFSRR